MRLGWGCPLGLEQWIVRTGDGGSICVNLYRVFPRSSLSECLTRLNEGPPHLPRLWLAGQRVRRRLLDLRGAPGSPSRAGPTDALAAVPLRPACPPPTPPSRPPTVARLVTTHAVPEVDRDPRLSSWLDWYRFARHQLECGHDEAVVYANLHTVEEQNRRRVVGGRASA